MNDALMARYLRTELHAAERQATRAHLTLVPSTTDQRRHATTDHDAPPEAA